MRINKGNIVNKQMLKKKNYKMLIKNLKSCNKNKIELVVIQNNKKLNKQGKQQKKKKERPIYKKKLNIQLKKRILEYQNQRDNIDKQWIIMN